MSRLSGCTFLRLQHTVKHNHQFYIIYYKWVGPSSMRGFDWQVPALAYSLPSYHKLCGEPCFQKQLSWLQDLITLEKWHEKWGTHTKCYSHGEENLRLGQSQSCSAVLAICLFFFQWNYDITLRPDCWNVSVNMWKRRLKAMELNHQHTNTRS